MMPALSPLAAIVGTAPQPSPGAARHAGTEAPPPGAGFSGMLKKASAQNQPPTQPVVRDTSARPPARPTAQRDVDQADPPATTVDEATADEATDPAAPATADAWRPTAPPPEPPQDGTLALAAAAASAPADAAASAAATDPAASAAAGAGSTATDPAVAAAIAAAATAGAGSAGTGTAPADDVASASAAPVTPPILAAAGAPAQRAAPRLDGGAERRGPLRAAPADPAAADPTAWPGARGESAGTAQAVPGGVPPQPPGAADTGPGRERAADSLPAAAAVADASAAPSAPVDSGPPATPAAPTVVPPPTGLASAAPTGTTASAGAPVEARVPVPVQSPEFAPAFGLQISTLARDGIEHARLQLNPADLGPISVRIAVDGTGARIDFQADAAVTRQAIEASLPALAGSLREAGLTLTGGGVSQQPQDRPTDPRQAGASGRPGGEGRHDTTGDDPVLARPAPTSRRGLVDLVA